MSDIQIIDDLLSSNDEEVLKYRPVLQSLRHSAEILSQITSDADQALNDHEALLKAYAEGNLNEYIGQYTARRRSNLAEWREASQHLGGDVVNELGTDEGSELEGGFEKGVAKF